MSATTPRRANTAAQSPSKATPRRVLGDLPPKSLNTPSKQTSALDVSEGLRAQSPLKQVTTLSPQLRMGKENIASMNAYPQGRKRSIYEVDEAENVEIAKAMFGARDKAVVGGRGGLTAEAMQKHTNITTVDLPIPGSPTERNTPSPEPEMLLAQDNSQNTQASQFSFSNFVNTELLGSQTEAEQPPVPAEMKRSKAELLRTRLQFGFYKVETHQTSKRSSEIISTWESSFSEPNNASTSMPITSSGESATSYDVRNITLSPARRDAQPVFVEANLDPFRPIGKLTPAPVLLPTTVSSRMNYDYQLPSSPPQAVSPEQLMSSVRQEEDCSTPVPKRIRIDEKSEVGTLHDRLQSRLQEGTSTSSAVKGNAADGLVQLSHGS